MGIDHQANTSESEFVREVRRGDWIPGWMADTLQQKLKTGYRGTRVINPQSLTRRLPKLFFYDRCTVSYSLRVRKR